MSIYQTFTVPRFGYSSESPFVDSWHNSTYWTQYEDTYTGSKRKANEMDESRKKNKNDIFPEIDGTNLSINSLLDFQNLSMAYKKRKFKKRFKKFTKKKYGSNFKKAVKNIIKDKHMVCHGDNGLILSTVETVHCINGIKVGSAMYNRSGLNFTNLWVELAFDFWNDGPAPNTSCIAMKESTQRVCVIWDEQPNGGKPTYTDVFLSIDKNGDNLMVDDVINGIRPDMKHRFKLLYDELIDIPSYGINGVTSPMQQVGVIFQRAHKVFIPLKGRLTSNVAVSGNGQVGNAGTEADIFKGALFFITKNDTIVVNQTNGSCLKMHWVSRLCFYE